MHNICFNLETIHGVRHNSNGKIFKTYNFLIEKYFFLYNLYICTYISNMYVQITS